MGVFGTIAGVGMGIAQAVGQKKANEKQYEQTQELMDKQQAMNKDMAMFNNQQQMDMWKKTGPTGQMEQLKNAGLNPALMYGMGGGTGGSTQAAQGGGVSGGQAKVENVARGMGIAEAAQLALLQAQTDNIKADTENKRGDAANKPLVGKNLEANTGKTKLDAIISEYGGKEAKAMFEEVNQPNRDMQARAKTDEYSSISAMGQTMNELFINGKLRDKSLAEIEQIVASGAKTRAETKNIGKMFDILEENLEGVSLDNAIKKIEVELQQKTGIDRNSNGWLKILGRLFTKHGGTL